MHTLDGKSSYPILQLGLWCTLSTTLARCESLKVLMSACLSPVTHSFGKLVVPWQSLQSNIAVVSEGRRWAVVLSSLDHGDQLEVRVYLLSTLPYAPIARNSGHCRYPISTPPCPPLLGCQPHHSRRGRWEGRTPVVRLGREGIVPAEQGRKQDRPARKVLMVGHMLGFYMSVTTTCRDSLVGKGPIWHHKWLLPQHITLACGRLALAFGTSTYSICCQRVHNKTYMEDQ